MPTDAELNRYAEAADTRCAETMGKTWWTRADRDRIWREAFATEATRAGWDATSCLEEWDFLKAGGIAA